MVAAEPPPKVIHIKVGNMKIAELRVFLFNNWPVIQELNLQHKLVNVYLDRIIGID
jgi:predicted nuclease of predicted toxin-antitoxin system